MDDAIEAALVELEARIQACQCELSRLKEGMSLLRDDVARLAALAGIPLPDQGAPVAASASPEHPLTNT